MKYIIMSEKNKDKNKKKIEWRMAYELRAPHEGWLR
jgi:hypothetical protein